MLSERLTASPFVWAIGAFVTLMCCLPVLIAFTAGNADPVGMLAYCTKLVASWMFYSKEILVASWVLGAVMVLFLKRWRLSAALLFGGAAWIYGCVIIGSFILHAGAIEGISTEMWGLLMSIYCGDVASLMVLSYVLPSLVAVWRKKRRLRLLIGCNLLLSWIPGAWPLLLFLSLRS